MKLTIFTPVYNRKKLLKNLFDSLIKQTNCDFIWMIVDDGSTDNVLELVKSFQEQAPFLIKYYYQENQGKHVAHNLAVEKCNTELFVCVDSDDKLCSIAVEQILNMDRKYEGTHILGYYFRKVDSNGNISGGRFEYSGEYIGLTDLYHKYGFKGEMAIVFKTDLIRQYNFPIFKNEHFVTELVLYNQLNQIAPMVWVDVAIYEYEYQDNGYSNNSNKLIAQNPYGAASGYLSEAYYSLKFFDKVKNYAQFVSMKKIFLLKKADTVNLKIRFCVRITAMLLLPHYNKLFKIIRNTYQ